MNFTIRASNAELALDEVTIVKERGCKMGMAAKDKLDGLRNPTCSKTEIDFQLNEVSKHVIVILNSTKSQNVTGSQTTSNICSTTKA